jgi:hypothetical protein
LANITQMLNEPLKRLERAGDNKDNEQILMCRLAVLLAP